MDWTLIIDGNRARLKAVLAEIVALADRGNERGRLTLCPRTGGGVDRSARPETGGPSPAPPGEGATLSRHLHTLVLRLLRPAEAAARRLIIVMARNLTVILSPPRPSRPKPRSVYVRDGYGTGIVLKPGMTLHPRRPPPKSLSLPLLDPLRDPRPRRVSAIRSSGVPRIMFPGITTPFPVKPWRPPQPDDRIDASRLRMRLAALARALDDLPAQARRFARWRARRDAAIAAKRPHRYLPLRPGRAYAGRRPGTRRSDHAVGDVLADLHHFAREVLDRPDTS